MSNRPGASRRPPAPDTRASSAATADRPTVERHAADAASAAVLAVEVVGSVSMWVPIPLAWMWVGARIYDATGSLAADAGVAFAGFVVTTILVIGGLNRLDHLWVALRQRAGHDQVEGALTRVVVVSATLGIIGFLVWSWLLSQAFILPFMPTH
jgi:hypothetical protein